MKYQDESTKVSIVSVSRWASSPHLGQETSRHSRASSPASGDLPLGASSAPRRSGSLTGSWSSGTGTSPQVSQ